MDAEYLSGLFGAKGRVALVTGAKDGIGRAIALALARAGADVAVTSRASPGLREVAAAISGAGRRALPLELELRDVESVRAAVERTVAAFGRLDVLVNNAGTSLRIDALDYEQEDWDAVLETNLRGSFFLAQAAAREMRRHREGRIVNVSSTYGRVVRAQRVAYAASKAALEQMTRALALEWAAEGITVNAVAPASVRTPSREDKFADPEYEAKRARDIPMGRLCLPEDVVGAVLFLIGPGAGFVTGHTIVVDGGYTLP